MSDGALRTILHLDLDAFFASVEELDDPSLRGKPLIVAGSLRRGVVAAANYPVRRFGVRSAMPTAEAVRRCPDVLIRPPRRARYEELSGRVFAIFRSVSPLVEGLSIDEAFVDVTHSAALYGDGATIATLLRRRIRDEVGLTVSAGVATSKFVAKIASDQNKPDGLTLVPPGEEAAFLAPLPIERMWGVGPKTAPLLHARGVRRFADLLALDERTLHSLLGSDGQRMRALAQGLDDRAVDPWRAPKSIGAEETYDEDLVTVDAVRQTLLAHSQRIAARLLAEGYRGRTVSLKLKFHDFRSHSRAITLADAIADTQSIYEAANLLLGRFTLAGTRVRLTGVSVGGLEDDRAQRSLFADPQLARRDKLEDTVQRIKRRFGGDRLDRAALLTPASTTRRRPGPDNP